MKTKRFLGGLALGAIIGSAVGLFFNPTTGKKNREKFKKVAKQMSESLVGDVSNLKALGKKEYDAVVENIIKKHSKEDLLSKDAWVEIANELKLRYKDIEKEVKKAKTPKVIKKASRGKKTKRVKK